MSSQHFQGKTTQEHIKEKKSEDHGTTPSNLFSTAINQVQQATMLVLTFSISAALIHIPVETTLNLLILISITWSLWSGAKITWDSWGHLEHLHRLKKQ